MAQCSFVTPAVRETHFGAFTILGLGVVLHLAAFISFWRQGLLATRAMVTP